MRKFKYIGTEEEASDYAIGGKFFPKVGEIYDENVKFGGSTVAHWVEEVNFTIDEWEEVFDDKDTTPDPVNPQHYKNGEVECIEGIRSAVVGKDGFAGYLAGNTLKYIWRYESKGGVQDLEKASWYLNKLVQHEKGKVK